MAGTSEVGILADIEAIKKLKARYWRCMDKKLWTEMVACFTKDAHLAECEEEIDVEGGEGIVQYLEQNLGHASVITIHQGYNAEIELTGDTTAKGIWAFHSYSLDTQKKRGARGWGYYEDEYLKENGEWRIKSTEISRIRREKVRLDD